MPYTVTHLLVPMILLELFRHYFVKNKRAFPLHYVLIGGLAGVLPDLDFAVFYVLSFFGYGINEVHRTYSHSLVFALAFFIFGLLVYGFKNKRAGKSYLKLRNVLCIIAFGIFIHILLDFLVVGIVLPFYPLFSYSIGLNLVKLFPNIWQDSILQSIDAILLVVWLVSLEIRHKISDFV